MNPTISDIYRNWKIIVIAKDEKCSHFSFDITSPTGTTQSVFMGGITAERARERAIEMIEMAIAFGDEE